MEGGAAEVGKAMQFLQENFNQQFNSLFIVPTWIPTPHNLRIRRAVRRLDDVIYGFIRQRRQSRDGQERSSVLAA